MTVPGGRSPQVVVITGAAGGIGRALAKRYAVRGRRLLLIDLNSADATAAEIRADHDLEVHVAAVDVCDAHAVRKVLDDFAGDAPIDRVLHCAGVLAPTRSFAEVDPGDVRRALDVNVTGSFNVAQGALAHLVEGSQLALVASLGGLVAGYRYAAYSSSKFAVVGLAEVIRMELAPLGIRTQVICPGEVSTPMVREELASGDQVQRAVKLLSGAPISADRAAARIHAGVESGRFMVIPTGRARALWWATRLLPTRLRHAITDRQIRRAAAESAN